MTNHKKKPPADPLVSELGVVLRERAVASGFSIRTIPAPTASPDGKPTFNLFDMSSGENVGWSFRNLREIATFLVGYDRGAIEVLEALR